MGTDVVDPGSGLAGADGAPAAAGTLPVPTDAVSTTDGDTAPAAAGTLPVPTDAVSTTDGDTAPADAAPDPDPADADAVPGADADAVPDPADADATDDVAAADAVPDPDPADADATDDVPAAPEEEASTTDLDAAPRDTAAGVADSALHTDLAGFAPGVDVAGPRDPAPDIEGRIVQVRPGPAATGSRPDGDDAHEPASPASRDPSETTGSVLPAGYTPPPSPAYAPRPVLVVPRYARAAAERRTAPPEAASEATAETSPRAWHGRQGRRLLGVGLAFVLVAMAIALVTTVRDGGVEAYEFGQITAVAGGATVRTGDADSAARRIEQGESVRAGWVIEAPGDAAATVSLRDGGVVRVAGGGRLTFTDLADVPTADGATGPPEPAIVVEGGRTWINPGGSRAAAAVDLQVHIPDAVVTSTGNPVALDCTAACTVEAPAGGASLSTAGGAEMTPAPGENVTFQPPDAFDLAIGDTPSGWAQQNLDADAAAGLPEPQPDDTPGIRDSAVVDGTYSIVIDVVGAPEGDAIPRALQYSEGETYAVDLVADGSSCTSGSCTAPVTAVDAATGTAGVSDGSISLELVQPIDCYDETYTTVVVPGIGTTTVEATMTVDEVSHDGTRWRVRTFAGTGAVVATLTTRCNPGDVLGTATSPITIAGS